MLGEPVETNVLQARLYFGPSVRARNGLFQNDWKGCLYASES